MSAPFLARISDHKNSFRITIDKNVRDFLKLKHGELVQVEIKKTNGVIHRLIYDKIKARSQSNNISRNDVCKLLYISNIPKRLHCEFLKEMESMELLCIESQRTIRIR